MRPTSRIARLAGIFLLSFGLGIVALTLSTYLPKSQVNGHIRDSLPTLQREGILPARHWVFNTFVGDNFNDSVMLSLAYMDPDATALDTFAGAYYTGDMWDAVDALDNRVSARLDSDSWYQRYWQGYLVVLRSLLTWFTYDQIRVLNAVALGALSLASAVGLTWRLGPGAGLAFLVAAFAAAPPIVALNVQFVGVFYLALGGVLAVLALSRRYPTQRFDLELFAVLGIATAYFDMLTAPVVTLGLPLLTMVALDLKERGELRLARLEWQVLRSSATWAIGYAVFWASKWALVALTFPADLRIDVGEDLGHRYGSGYTLLQRLIVPAKNIANLVPNTRTLETPLGVTVDRALIVRVALTVGLALVAVIFLWAISRLRAGEPVSPWKGSTPLARGLWLLGAVGLYPYLWYLVVANHSDLHNYFTFRAQVVTVFALGLMLALGGRGASQQRR